VIKTWHKIIYIIKIQIIIFLALKNYLYKS